MSVPNFQLKLSAKARRDVGSILAFTLDLWGQSQMESYQALIDNAFTIVLNNPNIGRPYDRYRVYPVGSHRIFYRITNQTIYVMRVLHERMNTSNRLQEFE